MGRSVFVRLGMGFKNYYYISYSVVDPYLYYSHLY